MTLIKRIVVEMPYRNIGIGSALVIHALKNAAEDTPGFYWETGPCNRNLLEDLGFSDPRTNAEFKAMLPVRIFLVLEKDEFAGVLSNYEERIECRSGN
jgi:Acetyltransferase (GNAT) family